MMNFEKMLGAEFMSEQLNPLEQYKTATAP